MVEANRWMGRAFAIITFAAALLAYTKWVWQSGFDQGSAVALCVVSSLQNDGKLAADQPECQDAKRGERSPLWVLRRRDD